MDRRPLLILLALLGTATSARADERERFDVSFGFLAGQRTLVDRTFTREDAGTSALGGAIPREVLESGLFSGVEVYGLHWDLRLALSYLRMTMGFDLPFADLGASGAPRAYTLSGGPVDVGVTRVDPYELRFGLGVEVPIGPVVPFVDLIGAVQWVDVTLVNGPDAVEYESLGFGFAARAGAQVFVADSMFVEAAGEVGFLGATVWTATLSVGFAID